MALTAEQIEEILTKDREKYAFWLKLYSDDTARYILQNLSITKGMFDAAFGPYGAISGAVEAIVNTLEPAQAVAVLRQLPTMTRREIETNPRLASIKTELVSLQAVIKNEYIDDKALRAAEAGEARPRRAAEAFVRPLLTLTRDERSNNYLVGEAIKDFQQIVQGSITRTVETMQQNLSSERTAVVPQSNSYSSMMQGLHVDPAKARAQQQVASVEDVAPVFSHPETELEKDYKNLNADKLKKIEAQIERDYNAMQRPESLETYKAGVEKALELQREELAKVNKAQHAAVPSANGRKNPAEDLEDKFADAFTSSAVRNRLAGG